jgi:hypothetical protein
VADFLFPRAGLLVIPIPVPAALVKTFAFGITLLIPLVSTLSPYSKTIADWFSDTVQNMQRDSCKVGGGWDTDGDPFVMFSPNANNRGGGYYCVIGTCRAQGDNYWDYSGRAGGP